MSYTYTQDIDAPEAETTFVPSYARKSVKTKKVKTWMVLAPIAGVALIGGAVALLLNSGGEVQPLAEPAVAPAVAQPAPLSSTPVAQPMMSAPAASSAMPSAPAARTEAPAALARRAEAAPVGRASAAPAATSTTATPAEPTGPRAYESAPMAASPAPVQAPAVTAAPSSTPAPAIVVAPLN